jgi:hypothetical protein
MWRYIASINGLINNKRICLGILTAVALLALLVSCFLNPVPILQSGYAIPQGAMPDREPTYDDVMPTPGYGDSYRGNGIQLGKPAVWQHVESTQVKLNDGFEVVYRNHIETEAGQVRVNIFYIWKPGTPQGMKNDKVVLKLLHSQDNIQVRNIGEGLPSDGGLYEILLTAEIPPEIKPGDYDVAFILFINEKYQGTLPCTIHIVNKYGVV